MLIADLSRCDDMPIVMLIIPAGATDRTLNTSFALQVTRLADTMGIDGLGAAVDRDMSRR
jgi:hypothetical protein